MTTLQARQHPDCYPSDPAKALAFFRDALASCPADKLPPAPGGSLVGIVAPHIDFRVSLQSYAAAFRPLLDEPLADAYLILGVGHRSPLEWNLDRRDYQTPLGRALCATDLVDELAAGADPKSLFFQKRMRASGQSSFRFSGCRRFINFTLKLAPRRSRCDSSRSFAEDFTRMSRVWWNGKTWRISSD